MPRRASTDDKIDPVRSMLAASVAAPTPKPEPGPEPEVSTPAPAQPPQQQREVGEQRLQPRSIESKPRPTRPTRQAMPAAPRNDKKFLVAKKFLVTEDESERIDSVLDAISVAFGSKVSYSQASRALWTVMMFAEEAMAASPRRGEPLRRPSKGDAIGMAEYEEAIADYLRVALKRA